MTKLVAKIDDEPIVRRVAKAAVAAKARPVVVVTGYERRAVEEAVADLAVEHQAMLAARAAVRSCRGMDLRGRWG